MKARVVPQPLGSRIEKLKRKHIMRLEKSLKGIYDVRQRQDRKWFLRISIIWLCLFTAKTEVPLHKELLKGEFYARLT